MKKGDTVRFNANALGVVRKITDGHYVEGVTVGKGEEGKYLQPHDVETLEDWHFATYERDGETFIVPGHIPAHMEPVE